MRCRHKWTNILKAQFRWACEFKTTANHTKDGYIENLKDILKFWIYSDFFCFPIKYIFKLKRNTAVWKLTVHLQHPAKFFIYYVFILNIRWCMFLANFRLEHSLPLNSLISTWSIFQTPFSYAILFPLYVALVQSKCLWSELFHVKSHLDLPKLYHQFVQWFLALM